MQGKEHQLNVSYIQAEKGKITLVIHRPDGGNTYQDIVNPDLIRAFKQAAPGGVGLVSEALTLSLAKADKEG